MGKGLRHALAIAGKDLRVELRTRTSLLSAAVFAVHPLLSESVGCWVAESEVADLLHATERAHASCVIGSYPFWRDGKTGANFVIRSTDAEELAACTRSLAAGLDAMERPAIAGGI